MNKRYIFIIALITLNASFGVALAQEQLGLRERARKHYNQYEYFQASQLLQKLADVKKPVLADLELLADCYFKMKNYELAENWYSRVFSQPKSKTENLIKYGEVLKSSMKYNEAKQAFLQYVKVNGDQSRITTEIAGCDSSLVWMSKPTLHRVKNEALVNTNLSEFSVFPYQNKVFYTGEPDTSLFKSIYGRTGNPYLRIYNADKTNNDLSKPSIDFSVFNTGKYHIGPVSTNKDESVLYVTRTTAGKILELNEIDRVKYQTNNLELYTFKKNKDKWEELAFPYNNVQKYSIGQATLSADNKVLYFVSNMSGGFGGTDIWYCELESDGTWAKPQNAGALINTTKDEMFPYAGEEGRLYFSSNGWPGMGGLDVFVNKGSKQNWAASVNLRYPINSSADDFSFILFPSTDDMVNGYLSSNRKGGKGGDDIYSFTFTKPITKTTFTLEGAIKDRKTGKPISGANLTLYKNQVLIASQNVKSDGAFLFELAKETDYSLVVRKEKFHADTRMISTKGLKISDTLNVDVTLETLFEIGKVFALNNINYDFNKETIRVDAAKILDGLVDILRDNPSLEIELGSHTDSRGADKYNLALSQRRAQSAVNYLVSKGISRTRMVAKGYGETQLLNKCEDGVTCSDAQHQENRRTVFTILKY
jgi:outer membrane protein OmpA-like peptidoglycan-associated protein/tetratricopeptide (TPR) repeat protein